MKEQKISFKEFMDGDKEYVESNTANEANNTDESAFGEFKSTFKHGKSMGVLGVQLIICALFLVFCVAVKFMGGDNYVVFKSYTSNALHFGTDFSAEFPLSRFTLKDFQDVIETAIEPLIDKLTAKGGEANIYKSSDTAARFNASEQTLQLNEKLSLPVAGYITSPFGYRTHPITGGSDFHTWLDIAAAANTPVHAALDGIIFECGVNSTAGNYIIIRHKNGLETMYGHLNYSYRREGETVTAGDIIGGVGTTGVSTGNHLHFELRLHGVKYNAFTALKEYF